MQQVSLGRRVIALLIDWFVAVFAAALVTGTAVSGEGATNPFVVLGVFWFYSVVTVGLLGFTIGKRLVAIGVHNPQGRAIGLPMAALRQALVCVVIPTLVTNNEGRGLHDVFAQSRQVSLNG